MRNRFFFETLRQKLSSTMLSSLNHYFPEKQFIDFEVFHPKNFIKDDMQTRLFGTTEVGNLAARFYLDRDETINEFKSWMYELANSVDYSALVKLRPHEFWSKVLRDQDISMELGIRKLIRTSLAIPASSADAERSFSYMNIVKNSKRSNLAEQTLDDLLRITINGPPISDFQAAAYAKKWKGLHTNDPTPGGGRPRKRPVVSRTSTVNDGMLFTTSGEQNILQKEAETEERENEELELLRQLDDESVVFVEDSHVELEPLFPSTIF